MDSRAQTIVLYILSIQKSNVTRIAQIDWKLFFPSNRCNSRSCEEKVDIPYNKQQFIIMTERIHLLPAEEGLPPASFISSCTKSNAEFLLLLPRKLKPASLLCLGGGLWTGRFSPIAADVNIVGTIPPDCAYNGKTAYKGSAELLPFNSPVYSSELVSRWSHLVAAGTQRERTII